MSNSKPSESRTAKRLSLGLGLPPWVRIDGFLSLVVALVFLAGGFWGPILDRLGLGWLSLILWITCMSLAVLLGLSGIRLSRGLNRLAAMVALTVIGLWVCFFLVIALH